MTRRGSRVTVAGLAMLALASVSIDTGRTLHVVDMNGAPVPDVFIVYHHEGSQLNPVHPTSYQATGRSVVRSRSPGRVEIPFSAQVHWPFPIETHPRIYVDLVYAPALHNGLATIGSQAVVNPGAFAVAGDLANVSLADLSARPDLWEATLMNVSSMLGQLINERMYRPARRRARPDPMALTNVLTGEFSREYFAFLDRYGDVVRPRPEMPVMVRSASSAEEQQLWEETVDRDLAREPRWGDVARRLFATRLDQFTDAASASK